MRFFPPRAPLTRQQLGALGERHAARLLRAQGLRLLESNFRARYGGEVDLIARDGETLVFVEVRTRTSDEVLSPLASVDARKQQHIVRAARAYLRARRLTECPIRYDIVVVLATPTGAVRDIRHIAGAFIQGM